MKLKLKLKLYSHYMWQRPMWTSGHYNGTHVTVHAFAHPMTLAEATVKFDFWLFDFWLRYHGGVFEVIDPEDDYTPSLFEQEETHDALL